MSCTMARQGDRVQLEPSDMRLALNLAKFAKGGLSLATIEETQYLIKKRCVKFREEKMRSVQFPWHEKLKAAIQRHLTMFRQYHMPGCFSCHNCTARYPQTRWRCKETGVPPPNQHGQQTPQPTPPLPGTPPASTRNTFSAQCFEIINLPARYAYSHQSLPCAEFFTLDTSGQDSEHDTDFDLDMLPDKRTSTG